MEGKILEFIHRRFPEDLRWTDGNCYFFAVILKSVFGGDICYDVVGGHFAVRIGDVYYDHDGAVGGLEWRSFVRWDSFPEYDSKQFSRIVRDCIL